MKTVVKTHSRNPLHRRRKRLKAKERNETAIRADYNRRPCASAGHHATKKHSWRTNCLDCGISMSWDKDLKRYSIG
jgi:hypothetical protein